MKIIAVIPARAGSKRLPNKNKLDFCGKPLVCWTVEQALSIDWFHEIILTTNDFDIITICKEYTKTDNRFKIHIRQEWASQDDSTMGTVIRELFEKRKDEDIIICLLQPTSPLRDWGDVYGALEEYLRELPYLGKLISIYQKDKLTWKLNGAIYICHMYDIIDWKEELYEKNSSFFIMDKENSIDIDTIEDFEKAQEIMKKRMIK